MRKVVKRETEKNWSKAINFIPKKDEIIIYDCQDGIKIKIGDGITKVNDLPFSENSFTCTDGNFIVKEA